MPQTVKLIYECEIFYRPMFVCFTQKMSNPSSTIPSPTPFGLCTPNWNLKLERIVKLVKLVKSVKVLKLINLVKLVKLENLGKHLKLEKTCKTCKIC